MAQPNHSDQPDAGKFMNDLNQIVIKYSTHTEETYSSSQALADVESWRESYRAAFVDDDYQLNNANELATDAKNKIRRTAVPRVTAATEREHRQRHEQERLARQQSEKDQAPPPAAPALAAVVPPPPPSGRVPLSDEEVERIAARVNPGGGNGRGNGNNGTHATANADGGRDFAPFIVAGVVGLILLVVAGAIGWILLDKYDDNDSTPASNGGNVTVDNKNIEAAVSRCPESVQANCRAIAADYQAEKIDLAEATKRLNDTITQANASGSGTGGNTTGTTNNTGSSSGGFVNLQDGRSESSRSSNVHAVLGYTDYGDTGVGLSKSWAFTVPNGYVALVFGVTLNDNINKIASNRGFMVGYGQGDVNFTVVDGAYKVVPFEKAAGEWCMRIKQHRDNGWLMNDIKWMAGGEEPKCY